MKLSTTVALFSAAASASSQAQTYLFSNPEDISTIPSSYESAIMGRRVLALSKLATLSTIFPESTSHKSEIDSLERRPADVGNMPLGLLDYVADCEDEGNPTLLALDITTTIKNARSGSNVTLSMRWTPPYPPSKLISLSSRLTAYFSRLFEPSSSHSWTPSPQSPDPVPYSAANLPRFSLIGYLEDIEPDEDTADQLAACFTSKHLDAKYWLPGNRIHRSGWARLVVTHVYWIGGFGDRAFIGWIPTEEWKNVTADEWKSIKLPGEEKGWHEWTFDDNEEL